MSIFWLVYFCFCYLYSLCSSVCLFVCYIIVTVIFFMILYVGFSCVFSACPCSVWIFGFLSSLFIISTACAVVYLLNCCCLDIVHIYVKNTVIWDVIPYTLI
jgi:hypothetical protein